MKKAPRMKDIQNLIASYTANGITAHIYDFSSCNAHDIALILKIDRTNVSRVLNQLHRENRLIKLQGRPTLYLDAGVIHSFSTEPVPYTLPVGRDIQEYLHQDKPVRVREHSSRQTLTYTGIHANESLHSVVRAGRSLYPQAPSVLGACAPYGEGKHHFLKFFIEKAKELQLLGRHTQILEHVLSDAADEQNQIYNMHPETLAFLILDVQCSDMHIVQQVAEKPQKQHATLHSSWKVCYTCDFNDASGL